MEGGADLSRLVPEMSSRRLLVLAFVREYIARWGESPSQREIAAGLDISRTRVRELVRSLVKAGKLLRMPGPRGLALPAGREEAVRQLRDLGWEIIEGDSEGVGVARPPGAGATPSGTCPQTTLLEMPPLTYPPTISRPDKQGGGQ